MVGAFQKRTLPMIVTLITGLLMIVSFFFTIPGAQQAANVVSSWAVIILTLSVPLGVTYLVLFHYRNIRRRTPRQWYFSVWTMVVMVLFIVTGIVLTPSHAIYKILFVNLIQPITTSMFAGYMFFITRATYRSIKLRNVEAGLLLISAIIVMLMLAPAGPLIWPPVETIGVWILLVPTQAAIRGIVIGVALGAIILGLRTLLGWETGYLGAE